MMSVCVDHSCKPIKSTPRVYSRDVCVVRTSSVSEANILVDVNVVKKCSLERSMLIAILGDKYLEMLSFSD